MRVEIDRIDQVRHTQPPHQKKSPACRIWRTSGKRSSRSKTAFRVRGSEPETRTNLSVWSQHYATEALQDRKTNDRTICRDQRLTEHKQSRTRQHTPMHASVFERISAYVSAPHRTGKSQDPTLVFASVGSVLRSRGIEPPRVLPH